jgi:hypothetical protein
VIIAVRNSMTLLRLLGLTRSFAAISISFTTENREGTERSERRFR